MTKKSIMKKCTSWLLVITMVLSLVTLLDTKAFATDSDLDVEAQQQNYWAFQWDDESAKWFTDNPNATTYYISNAKELGYLAFLVDTYDWAPDDVNAQEGYIFAGKTFVLTADIDLSGYKWLPIGYTNADEEISRIFAGNFDGNGHTISNMTIGIPVESIADEMSLGLGFFGQAEDGVIKNLGVTDFSITTIENLYGYVGGVLGKGYDVQISNCYSTGEIQGIEGYYGGLVGVNYNYSSSSNATISDSYSNVKITLQEPANPDDSARAVGGLMGRNMGYVVNCYASGVITTTCYTYTGGLLGRNSADVTNCYANVSITNGSDIVNGGLIGFNYNLELAGARYAEPIDNSVTNCFWNTDKCLNGIGTNSDVALFESCTGKTDTQMKSSDFVALLNANKGTYSSWMMGADQYPTFGEKSVAVVEVPAGIENPSLISIKPSAKAFDQSVEVKLIYNEEVRNTILNEIKEKFSNFPADASIFPLDISLYVKGTNTKIQPKDGESVEITIPIPTQLLANKDKIVIACVIDGELKVLPTTVKLIDGVYCVVFTANHFSPYAFVVDQNGILTSASQSAVPVNATAVKTGDSNNVVLFGGILFIAISILAGSAIYNRKRNFLR